MTAHGNNLPLEDRFRRIRLSMKGAFAMAKHVKEEPGEEMTLPVGNIFYTQKSCAARFQGGPYAGQSLEGPNRHPCRK